MSRKLNNARKRQRVLEQQLESARRWHRRQFDDLQQALTEAIGKECPDFVRAVVLHCERDQSGRRAFPTYAVQMHFQPEHMVRSMLYQGNGNLRDMSRELRYIADKIARQAFDVMVDALRKDGVFA